MLIKLLQFEVFYQLKQRAFPLFALLFFALGVFVGQQGFAPQGVHFNSVYQVYFHTSLFTLGSVFIIMFFAISAMLRDKQHTMEGIVFSTSVKKPHYFLSRFLGTFIFSVLSFSPFVVGYIFGNYFFGLDAERIATFKLITYLQPWLYIVLPNVFICSAVVFSVCTLTKKSIATYASAVCIYTLYFISSMVLNSPLLAQATPASPESMAMAALADPFGIAAFFEQTQFWTTYQKNNQLLSFSGLFLLNRVIWVVASIALLTVTYRLFSFRKLTKKVKKEKRKTEKNISRVAYSPLQTTTTSKAQGLAFLSLLKLELKGIFKSLTFVAVFVMWLVIVFSELFSTTISGGEYGVSLYPFTNELIALLVDPLTLFSLLLIVFYSAEIVWKERSLNFNLLIDATPIQNNVFFLSKFTALLLLPFLLITSGIVMCLLFQIALGYSNFEFGLYASLYYFYGLQLVIFCMIALFISSFSKTKFMGMGLFALVVLLTLKSGALGLEHPLSSLGFLPRVSYTNMNGFYGGVTQFHHVGMYWLAFGLLLTLISFKVWNRGVVASFKVKLQQLASNWTPKQRLAVAVLSLLFISSGSLVYYNTNIVSDYTTINDTLDFRAGYEKQFKKYEVLDRPSVALRKTEVAMYPKEQRYTVKANYTLKNKSNKPMSEIFITERIPLEHISLEKAKLIQQDSDFGIYLFQFEEALQVGDSIQFQFELEYAPKGYEESKAIVANGSYITHRDFEPILGYSSGVEIIQKKEREKRGLAEKIEEPITDTHIQMEETNMEKVPFETIVSTSEDQTALSSGRLIKEWTENNRTYYHFKTDQPVTPMIAYFSATYETQNSSYEGISIEQYYDKAHAFNIADVEKSIKTTLEYCQTNFGDYAFNQVRIAEIPSHWPFGGFAHPGVISMVENRLYLNDVSDSSTFNLVAKRTIHEVAHQWWGHTLSAKPVAGGSLLIEGFAKYTEAVIMEKMYGKRAVYALSEDARRKYFNYRSFANGIEPPVYKVLGQAYISYGKTLHVLLALRDLIGEDKINTILKSITDRYRSSTELEVNTLDFLAEVYKVTPQKYHTLIDDWFKKVITYDLAIDETSSYKPLPNGTFEVTVKVHAKRFSMLESGDTKPIAISEPIKIGVFTTHPSQVKHDSEMLFYESSEINQEMTEVKLIVKEKPSYIAIDPYGTRSDENLADNVIEL